MENIEQMRTRHTQEIEALQASCAHGDISGWMPFAWAPGHYTGEVKICYTCGQIVERRPLSYTSGTAVPSDYDLVTISTVKDNS